MEFLRDNWFWTVVFVFFILMHGGLWALWRPRVHAHLQLRREEVGIVTDATR